MATKKAKAPTKKQVRKPLKKGSKPTAKPGPAAKARAIAKPGSPGKAKTTAKPRSAVKAKPAAKPGSPVKAKTSPKPRSAVKPKPAARPKPTVPVPLDLSALPAEAVAKVEKWICLACVLDVFTRLMGLAPKTAHTEIRNYTPAAAELWAAEATRPYFEKQDPKDPCPYCGSAAKWQAHLAVHRIESGKATDAARRDLVKKLSEGFLVVEEKATRQDAFFDWLESVSTRLDLDDPRWLRDLSVHYLGRREPKTDWEQAFTGVHGIRRSRRLEDGWEIDDGRLFLAPMLFDELLLVQYLVSRSHKAGGLTLEGRYTLPELFVRLRNSGYLRSMEVPAGNAADALEQLVAKLSGGETAIRFYYIVDRRDFLDKLKALRLEKVPRPKRSGKESTSASPSAPSVRK